MLKIEVTKDHLARIDPKQRAAPPMADDLAPAFDRNIDPVKAPLQGDHGTHKIEGDLAVVKRIMMTAVGRYQLRAQVPARPID